MKSLQFSILILLLSFPSLATVNRLAIKNNSNRSVACAFVEYDEAAKSWATYSWWIIKNNQTANFTNLTYLRCEQVGDSEKAFGSDRNFCVTRGEFHVTPFHRAESQSVCDEFNGEWRGFKRLPDAVSHTFNVNP